MKRLCIVIICILFAHSYGQAQTVDSSSQITKVKVFPNPATNVVNVLGLKNSIQANILISDIYGNIVLKHRWKIKNNALNIPIATLESGLYIISIRSKEQEVTTKFYKQ